MSKPKKMKERANLKPLPWEWDLHQYGPDGKKNSPEKWTWPATGKWEVYSVYDSNWEKHIPYLVSPDGKESHVFAGTCGEYFAREHADVENGFPPDPTM